MSSSKARHIEVRIPRSIPENTRIDAYIADVLKLFSRSQVKQRVTDLRVNGSSAKVSKHLLPGDRLEITLAESADPQELLRSLVDRVRVQTFEVKVPSLHEIFVELVGKSDAEDS